MCPACCPILGQRVPLVCSSAHLPVAITLVTTARGDGPARRRGWWMFMLYLLRRVAGIIPVLLLTWTLVFAVLQIIPGDPVNLILGGAPASQQVRDNER